MHAAFKSNASTRSLSPRSRDTRQASAGVKCSVVAVAQITSDMSFGSTPAAASAFLEASTASESVVSPDAVLRERIPVLELIHSSFVSMTADNILFVTSFSGRLLPVPRIFKLKLQS